MAEAVGLAASLAGLASLAIQLTDGVVKLQSFLRDVKDAPQGLTRTIEELGALSSQLRHITEFQRQRLEANAANATIAAECLKRCLEICQNAVARISNVVIKLDKGIRQKVRFGKFRAALNKTHMKELHLELNDAKLSLILAHQIYNESLRQQDVEAQKQRLDEIHIAVVSTAVVTPTANQHPLQEQRSVRSVRSVAKRSRKKFAPTLTVPIWLTNQIWIFQIESMDCCWSLHVRAIRIVPSYSKIFKLCEAGDQEGIQRMLASGEATFFDQDQKGHNLLKSSILSGNVSLCRFFLTQCPELGIDFWSPTGLDPLFYYTNSIFPDSIHETAAVSLYRFFLTETEPDVDIEPSELRWRMWYHCAPAGILRLIQQAMALPYLERPLRERLKYALSLNSRRATVEDFLCALGTWQLTEEIAQAVDPEHGSVMYFAAASLGSRFGSKDQGRVDSWQLFLQEAIRLGGPLHAGGGDNTSRTAMLEFTSSYDLCDYNFHDNTNIAAARLWAEALLSAGVDLTLYGKEEAERWRQLPKYHEAFELGNLSLCWYFATSFTHGARPKDWSITRRRCGKVWMRKANIPGAWRHDNLEHERMTMEKYEEGGWDDCHEWEFDRWTDISSDDDSSIDGDTEREEDLGSGDHNQTNEISAVHAGV